MRFLFNLAVAALLCAVAVFGLINGKYETSSACQAAQIAIQQETPGILTELAERDGVFSFAEKATRHFKDWRNALRNGASNAVAQGAERELKDASALECAGLVLYREFHPQGFRRLAVDKIMEQRSQQAAR